MAYSLSKQDIFAIEMIGKGTYLEIGASHPQDASNTYLLEKQGWTGISIDIDNQCEQLWKHTRTNQLIIDDALTYDYGGNFDYLSIDTDPPTVTLAVLKRVIKTCRFKVITFETDFYYDKSVRDVQRKILKHEGYTLAVPGVQCEFGEYEDWWIDTKFIDIEKIKTWQGLLELNT